MKIEIDRHILLELAEALQVIDKAMPRIQKALQAHEKSMALVTHLVGKVELDKEDD